jgi:hypothetical protein
MAIAIATSPSMQERTHDEAAKMKAAVMPVSRAQFQTILPHCGATDAEMCLPRASTLALNRARCHRPLEKEPVRHGPICPGSVLPSEAFGLFGS